MPFISCEGGEGSGKTTVLREIKERLERLGKTVVLTREPGGTELAESIRSLLLDQEDLDIKIEVLLFAAARRSHWLEVIEPALKRGDIVLCDRFKDSSYVYQGYVGKCSIKMVKAINDYVTMRSPDVTFFLEVEPGIGLNRIKKNSEREQNRIDRKELAFHHEVLEGYLKLVEKEPKRFERINANRGIDEVIEDVWGRLIQKL